MKKFLKILFNVTDDELAYLLLFILNAIFTLMAIIDPYTMGHFLSIIIGMFVFYFTIYVCKRFDKRGKKNEKN